MKVESKCSTFSSMVFSVMRPVARASFSLSGAKYLVFGISRSSPPLAGPMVEYTEVQSLISIPLKPYISRSTVLLSQAFSVE